MSLNSNIKKIDNFDSLIFSLLTRQKTIFVGVGKMSDEFFKVIQDIVPEDLKPYLTYGTYENSTENNNLISSLEMKEESMKVLDRAQDKYTVVFLPANEIYGQYTSPFCKKAAALFKEDKIAGLKEELTLFYKQAIESDEIVSPADYMSEHQIHKADASLVMWIRALHYEKEIDSSLFIDMKW